MILLGAILPDLLDKSLYYGLVLIRGREAMSTGLITGTRTFGHTLLLMLLVAAAAAVLKYAFQKRDRPLAFETPGVRALAALSLGMASHLFLDVVSDLVTLGPAKTALSGYLWPFVLGGFPANPYASLSEQIHRVVRPFYFWAEALGLAILIFEYWKFTKNPKRADQ